MSQLRHQDPVPFMRAIPSRPRRRQHRNIFTYLDTPTPMRSLPDPARARSCSLVVITEPDTAIDDRFDQSSLDSGIGLTGPEWSFKARKRPAVDPDALGPPGWDALDVSATVGCDAARGDGKGAMGGWNASSETWGSSDSFSAERTYYVEDYGFAGGEGQSSTCQPPRTGAVNARGLLVKSPDSCGPVALPASHSLGQPTGVVEDESYQAHVEHPVRVPDVTTTDYYGVQEQESSKTSRTAAESQRTAVAQDQASMDRLVVENQSLRLMLATALKTGASTKTTDVRGGGPTTVTDDATSTLDSMRRHLQALANLVEAERDIRIHLMSIYDQELNRARGNLAAAGFCIEDTRYILEGFAAKMSQFGSGAAFDRTAPGSGDTMVLINEEKAKRNALSSLIDERLEGLAERVGRPSAGSDALHQSFARDVDKLNVAVKMQRQGCARTLVDLSQDMDLLAAKAESREAHLQSRG